MIRFGIIGMGIRGQMYGQGIQKNPSARVAAVCDISDEGRKTGEEMFGVKSYGDHRQMLDDAGLDAVIVATPDFAHFDAVMDAARTGLDILVEKPLSTTFSQAQQMARCVNDAGVGCMVAFENRFNSPFINAKEAVTAGELGNIVSMNCRLNDTIFVPTKMLTWAGKSSPAWFLLTHVLDMACYLKQQPVVEVDASGHKGILTGMGIETYDMIQTLVRFADGTSAVFENGWILPESMPAVFDLKFEVIGDKGAIFIDTQDQMMHKSTDKFEYPGSMTRFPVDMLDAFIETLEKNQPPPVALADAVENVRIVEAVHCSLARKEPVKL